MLVKRLLTWFPVTLLLFLAISVIWVPSIAEISQNESRLNRMIMTLSGDPQSMHPWLASSTTDSDVYKYIFEAPFKLDGNFKIVYGLADKATINEEIVINLDPEVDAKALHARIDAHMSKSYPDIYGKTTMPEDFRVDAYHGKAEGRYIVNLSSDPDLGINDIPREERFMAAYEPDLNKPCQENLKIPRLVIHLRPDPDVKRGKDEIANAVIADIEFELIMLIEEAAKAKSEESKEEAKEEYLLPGFITNFDPEISALKWYQAYYGLEVKLPVLEKLKAADEKDGDGVDGPLKSEEPVDEDSSKSDVEIPEDSDEASKNEAKKDEKKEASEEAKKKEPFLFANYPSLGAINQWNRFIGDVLKAQYESLDKAPSKETIEAWITKAEEACKQAVKDAEAEAKKANEKAMTFGAFMGKAPKKRVQEFPVVKMHIREGVKWHDYGTEWKVGPLEGQLIEETVDSGDFAFTFAFGGDRDINSKRSSYAKSIQQIRVHDDYNISFIYAGVYSPAIIDLASASIMPEHRFRKDVWIEEATRKGRGPAVGETNYKYKQAFPATKLDFNRDPVGTGPMTLAPLNGSNLPKWRSGEKVRIQRFPDYWNPLDRPVFEFMDYYVFDPNMGLETSEIVFRSGGTDAFGIRSHNVDSFIEEREKYYVYQRPNLVYEYLAFNLDRPQFKELAVRQALTMGIDVDNIIKYVANGQGIRVNQPAYPMLPYYDQEFVPDYTFVQGEHKGKTLREAGMTAFPYDVEEAKSLLDQNGWVMKDGVRQKNGVKLEFTLINGGMTGSRSKVMTLAAEKWEEIGCKVKIEGPEWNVFLQEHVLIRNYDALVLGWSGGSGFDKRQLWHSDNIKIGGFNFVAFRNAQADDLMERMIKTYVYEEQVELAHQLNAIIANQCPYVFLHSPLSNVAMPRQMYWAKPIVDEMGNPVLDANGRVKRERRSIIDPEIMSEKYGPRTYRMQMARGREIEFGDNENELDNEPYLVGSPDKLWKDHPSNK